MNQTLLRSIGAKFDDRRKLAMMVPVFFLCGIAEMLNYNGYMTLFNQRFGSEYLPYVYGAEAVIMPLEAWFMSWLTSRLSKPQLMRTLFAIMGIIIACNAVVLLIFHLADFSMSAYYPFLFLSSSFVVRQQTILLWSLAVDLCPTQQGKRLMPVFVSSAALGGIAAGLLAQVVSRWLGADAVYMLAPLFMLAGGVNYWKSIAAYLVPLTLKQERSGNRAADEGGLSSADYFKRTFTTPYLLIAVGVMTLMPALYFLMEYVFLNVSRTYYPTEASFGSFFGLITTLLFTAAFLLQLLSARIMNWLGQSNMLPVIAIVFTCGFLLAAITFGTSVIIYALSVGYMFLYLLLYYFAEPANQLFFKLLPIRQRDGYRYVAQGIAASAGILIGALLQALHAGLGMQLQTLAWYGAAGAVCLVGLAYVGRYFYIRELVRSVQQMTDSGHDLDAAFDEFMREGRSALLLGQLLESPNDYSKEIALGLIGRTRDASYLAPLLKLVDDRSARIRIASLRAMNLERAELQALVKVASFLEDPDYEVRAEGVRLLGRASHMSHQAVYFIRLKLLDANPKVVAEAVKALYFLQNEQSFEACYEVIQRYLKEGGEPAVYMCRVIADLGMYSFLQDVEVLLGEFDPAVRAAAIACMGKLQHNEVVPWLLEQLEWAEPALYEVTIEALIDMGGGVIETLLLVIEQSQPKVWSAAVRVLARLMDESQCQEILIPACLSKLAELRKHREIESALLLHERTDRAELARMRLTELMGFVLGGVWLVMARLGEEDVIQSVRRAVEDSDEEIRESGLEALMEGAADKRMSGALITLLEVWQDAAPELPSAEEANVVLRAAAAQQDMWLQLLASEALRQKEEAGMSEHKLMGMLDKVVFLKQVPFFSDLSLEELGYIAGVAVEETHAAGSRLVTASQANAKLGVIVEGTVQLVSGGSQGGVIAELGVRDVFGETSALDGTPATATARASVDVRILSLVGEEMAKLIRLHPEIGIGLLKASLSRVRMLEQAIAGRLPDTESERLRA
ncbi:cyclic nucleotide-binding domain-containing protein [Paenibacillus sp. R14(2021)]|uniref:cyclic nucleotide-binding domain-containing protein n=1 Tax=Paenibacillus sp. R14(2021) TaxID=2859228 RepID=UPI001C61372E|nr:cyclic nucleotide-binding domain-containing protein [Paenibacillus sp. R14(2021)]